MRFNLLKPETILYLCPVFRIKTNMKKINITTIALLVYLIVMSIIGWPGNNPGNSYTEYFLMIGATLVIIILLRYLQVKRLRMRDKWNKDDDPAKQ